MAIRRKNRVWVDCVMIAFAMLFPHYARLPMYAYPFVVLGMIWIYLNFNGESFNSIGFRFSDLKFKAFYTGGALGLVYAVFSFWALGPLITRLGFKSANLSDFNFIRHNLLHYLLLILLAAVLVIPYEEIVFRGFIFNRIKTMLGKSFLVSGIITCILFALYHWQEGVGAMIGIFIFALVITWLYKIFHGNLWYLIFFHLGYDVFMLGMVWTGKM